MFPDATDIRRAGNSQAVVGLSPADSIPNKAFILHYAVMGKATAMAVLPHVDAKGQGYFMLMVQPAEDERLKFGQRLKLLRNGEDVGVLGEADAEVEPTNRNAVENRPANRWKQALRAPMLPVDQFTPRKKVSLP